MRDEVIEVVATVRAYDRMGKNEFEVVDRVQKLMNRYAHWMYRGWQPPEREPVEADYDEEKDKQL